MAKARSSQLTIEDASVLVAPYLAMALHRFQDRLEAVSVAGVWSEAEVEALKQEIDGELWMLNMTMAGDQPGVDFKLPDMDAPSGSDLLPAHVSRELGPLLERSCLRLQAMEPKNKTLPELVRYALDPYNQVQLVNEVKEASAGVRATLDELSSTPKP